MNQYQRNCKRRLEGILQTRAVPVHKVSHGSLNGSSSYCFVLEPWSSNLDLAEISASAQKCFRKATVMVGKGAHPTYAPEMNFPTIYLTFDK